MRPSNHQPRRPDFEEKESPDFSNAAARDLQPGNVIIERDHRGMVVKRTPVTRVEIHPVGCTNKVHATVFHGTEWCYEPAARVEIE